MSLEQVSTTHRDPKSKIISLKINFHHIISCTCIHYDFIFGRFIFADLTIFSSYEKKKIFNDNFFESIFLDRFFPIDTFFQRIFW